jgi:hypothetical protein
MQVSLASRWFSPEQRRDTQSKANLIRLGRSRASINRTRPTFCSNITLYQHHSGTNLRLHRDSAHLIRITAITEKSDFREPLWSDESQSQ